MEDLFTSVLNMSLTASYVIVAIILVRLLLKKAPKFISYILWAVAGFRLIFPFSFESVFSLIPFKSQPIPADIAMQPIPRVDSGITVVDNVVSSILPAATPVASVNPLQIWQTIGAYLWLAGIAVMLIYSVVSIILLNRQLQDAVLTEGNIYEADNLKTPFVLGFIHSKIFIPSGLSAEEKSYIILHEQTHIKRIDHLVKLASFLILCVHWFNPLVWIAFLLMSADMEMSCDERVLREIGGVIKKSYSTSLLSMATGRRLINGSPLAFGEGNIKGRIKNVMNFKKPATWVIAVSVLLVAALSIGFAANKASDESTVPASEISLTVQPQNLVSPVIAGPVNISVPVTLEEPEKTLVDYFKSIGYNARLVSKDDNVKRGNEIGLILKLDLGNDMSFNATAFKRTRDGDETWEIIDSHFVNPKDELLKVLIEQQLDEIITMKKSEESDWNKSAFKDNTLLEIESYGKPALDYMLEQFAKGNGKDERGDLMAEACILILGNTNNVPKGWKSGEEWYSQLKPLKISALPPVSRPEGKTLEELVTAAALEHYKPYNKNGVVLVAPQVFGKYEEDNMLTIWATVLKEEYLLYGKKLVEDNASRVPAAIKLRKDSDGSFTLVEYIVAKDGAGFAPSVREFCKPKSSVAERILEDYGKKNNLHDQICESLLTYLKANNLTGIFLEGRDGTQKPLT